MVVDLILLAAAVALIIANGVFVAAEFSLVTVERTTVTDLADKGDRGAKGIATAIRELSFQLSGAQLGITITSLLLGVIAEPAIAHLLKGAVASVPGVGEDRSEAFALAVALFLATVAQMVLGELVPKNAALASPLTTARFATPPQRLFSLVFGPLIRLFNWGANAIVRRFGVEPQEELASARSPDELSLLLRLSAEAGALPPSTAAMLHRALRFPEKVAAEAMTPRVDCHTVAAGDTLVDLLEVARETGHLRFPVRRESLDDIVGVIAIADAFAVPDDRRSEVPVAAVARPAVLVPGSLDLSRVQARLREADADLAVVVDEYGGFAGIISTEDLAEELVGEVADEYDEPEDESGEPASTILGAGQSRVMSAMLRADEVFERIGFAMPEGPYETLAGLVLARLERIPDVGDDVTVDGWEFVVEVMQGRRIEQVRVTAPVEPEDEAAE